MVPPPASISDYSAVVTPCFQLDGLFQRSSLGLPLFYQAWLKEPARKQMGRCRDVLPLPNCAKLSLSHRSACLSDDALLRLTNYLIATANFLHADFKLARVPGTFGLSATSAQSSAIEHLTCRMVRFLNRFGSALPSDQSLKLKRFLSILISLLIRST